MSKSRLVVLISGSGSNLQAIIDHIDAGEINASILSVISNKADAYGLERAKVAGIATAVVDHTHYENRELFDQALAEIIDQVSPDIIVLAGFMRILTKDFVMRFAGKLINIHPSLLPLYRGLHTHKRALQDKASEHGASVHFVTPELDSGAVITQGIVSVNHKDTEETLAMRVHQIEHIIYPQAVKLLTENQVELRTDHIYINNQLLQQPKLYHLKK
ncbi:MAG TPA: phosphoribosylglycinamide formyltransferase [Leucothrix mucor]|uniref:Phosphoribosylglycinamide formyltransferase n=1 Tax=Leucothrix mucor TaxID=45248 RepID=A0A7V2WUJ0_LEUMU|nr:phosphoribosylglycinamide formyltransferase [Leucothrix mucor]